MDSLLEILSVDTEAVTKTIKKKEILQKQGTISKNAFYVKKGLLRSYSIDEKGKEHIFMFGSDEFPSIPRYLRGTPSQDFKIGQ